MDVLMSIKPEFANKIFTGEKKYEYRKKLFSYNGKEVKVYVYSSSPVKRIIGEFTTKGCLCLPKEELWERTKDDSGISKEFFDEYFSKHSKGYAIKIYSIKSYETPVDPKEIIDNFKAPQSYMFVENLNI